MSARNAIVWTLTASVLIALVTPTAIGDGPVYRITELKADGSAQSKAYGINNTGQIVGWTIVDGSLSHAAHWLNEVFTDLHGVVHLELLHPYPQFSGDVSEVYSISNADQIVGAGLTVIECPEKVTILNAMIIQPAVLSDLATPYPGDSVVNLGSFAHPCVGHDSAAVGISNRNHVVGWADVDGGGTVHAFLVTPVNGEWAERDPNTLVNNHLRDLGTIDSGSTVSAATAVNDEGTVVGYTYIRSGRVSPVTGLTEAGYHAFRVVPLDADADGLEDTWFSGALPVNDLMEDLGTLGGNNSWARDINNMGQIVGESDTPSADTRAFLWQNGQMSDLGTLGGANSSASRVNELGQVVGWAENAAGQRRAFVYVDGVMYDLNSQLLATANPKITLAEARDINDSGQIVGWGVAKNGTQDVFQAFLLQLATAEEIAEAEAAVAQQSGGGTTVDSGGSSGGASGGATASGVTIAGTPNTLADAPGTNPPESDADDGAAPASPSLCGAGLLGFLPLMILTALGLRGRIRA